MLDWRLCAEAKSPIQTDISHTFFQAGGNKLPQIILLPDIHINGEAF